MSTRTSPPSPTAPAPRGASASTPSSCPRGATGRCCASCRSWSATEIVMLDPIDGPRLRPVAAGGVPGRPGGRGRPARRPPGRRAAAPLLGHGRHQRLRHADRRRLRGLRRPGRLPRPAPRRAAHPAEEVGVLHALGPAPAHRRAAALRRARTSSTCCRSPTSIQRRLVESGRLEWAREECLADRQRDRRARSRGGVAPAAALERAGPARARDRPRARGLARAHRRARGPARSAPCSRTRRWSSWPSARRATGRRSGSIRGVGPDVLRRRAARRARRHRARPGGGADPARAAPSAQHRVRRRARDRARRGARARPRAGGRARLRADRRARRPHPDRRLPPAAARSPPASARWRAGAASWSARSCWPCCAASARCRCATAAWRSARPSEGPTAVAPGEGWPREPAPRRAVPTHDPPAPPRRALAPSWPRAATAASSAQAATWKHCGDAGITPDVRAPQLRRGGHRATGFDGLAVLEATPRPPEPRQKPRRSRDRSSPAAQQRVPPWTS